MDIKRPDVSDIINEINGMNDDQRLDLVYAYMRSDQLTDDDYAVLDDFLIQQQGIINRSISWSAPVLLQQKEKMLDEIIEDLQQSSDFENLTESQMNQVIQQALKISRYAL